VRGSTHLGKTQIHVAFTKESRADVQYDDFYSKAVFILLRLRFYASHAFSSFFYVLFHLSPTPDHVTRHSPSSSSHDFVLSHPLFPFLHSLTHYIILHFLFVTTSRHNMRAKIPRKRSARQDACEASSRTARRRYFQCCHPYMKISISDSHTGLKRL